MADRKIFTREELQQHLEAIDVYWHRHGSAERDDLEGYLEELFSSLPERAKDTTVEQKAAALISISYNETLDLLNQALCPVYSATDTSEVLDEIWAAALAQGAIEEGDLLTVKSGIFLEFFDLKFNSIILNDELFRAIGEVRKSLLRRTAKIHR